MAFISAPIPQEQQNQFAQPGLTTPNPLSLLPPQAGGSAGAGGAGPTGGQTPTTQFASPASKLSDYLAANQDQTQAQGAKIAGDLSTNYGQITGAVDQAGQGFGQQVSSSYTPYNPSVVDQAAANPTSFASKPENVSAFKSQFDDTYTGPSNFESTAPYATVQNQVQSAVENAGQLGTQSGLSTYLGNNAKGTYTPGMQTLDAALVQGNAPAFKQITEAAKPYAGLSGYLNEATKKADSLVPTAQSDAAKASQYARNTFLGPNGVAPTFKNTLTTQLGKANTDRDSYNANSAANQQAAQAAQMQLRDAQAAAQQKYSGNVNNLAGNPTSAAAENARIASLIDPTPYIGRLDPFAQGSLITSPASLDNTATADQYGEDLSLEQLLGANYDQALDQSKVGQAGTFSVPQLGSVPDISGETQYMGDVASLYGIPGLANANAPGGWNNPNPIPVAQAAYNASKNPGQGVTVDPTTLAALQRLISNQYAGRT